MDSSSPFGAFLTGDMKGAAEHGEPMKCIIFKVFRMIACGITVFFRIAALIFC